MDVKAKVGKARTVFLQSENIWNPKQLSANINVKILNTNVMTVLPFETVSWRTATAITKNVQVFTINHLRKILNVR